MSHTNGTTAQNGQAFSEQQTERYLVSDPLIGYTPSLPSWGLHSMFGDDGRPSYQEVFFHVEAMLAHPRVSISLAYLKAGISNLEVVVEADDSKVGEFVQQEWDRFFTRARKQSQYSYEFGRIGCAAKYCVEKSLLRFDSCFALHPYDCTLLTRARQYVGFRVRAQGVKEPIVDMRAAHEFRRGSPAHGLWFAHSPRFHRWFGWTQLYGGYRPWRRLASRDGAEEIVDMAIYRYGVAGPIVRFPTEDHKRGTNSAPGVDPESGRQKAREIHEGLKAGAGMGLSSVKYPQEQGGGYKWEVEWPQHVLDVAPLLSYNGDLEKQVSLGIGVPNELFEAAEVGSGYSGRAIPLEGFLTARQEDGDDLVRQWKEQVAEPLVEWNFGPGHSFNVRTKSLLESKMKLLQSLQQPPTQPGQPSGQPQPGQGAPEQIQEPPQPAQAQQAQQPLEFGLELATGEWQQYAGPQGGRGWRNAATGKVVYQTERPGTEGSTDAKEAGAPAAKTWGKILTDDVAHVRIIGPTRSGKSVLAHALAQSLPGKVFVIDPSWEPNSWGGLPVVTVSPEGDYEPIRQALKGLLEEMKRRGAQMQQGQKDFERLNIFFDEVPDTVSELPDEAGVLIRRLGQRGRHGNIHLYGLGQSDRVGAWGIEGYGDAAENFATILLGSKAVAAVPELAGTDWPAVLVWQGEKMPISVKGMLDKGKQPIDPSRAFRLPGTDAELGTHAYGCALLELPEGLAEKVKALAAEIPAQDLAEEGIEQQPHITALFGIHNADAAPLRQALRGYGMVSVTLGATSCFENDEADVLKVEVFGPDVFLLNQYLALTQAHTQTHATYKPHLTVGYVRKGKGKKYAGDTRFDGVKVKFDSLTFAPAEGEPVCIPLGNDPPPENSPAAAKDSDAKHPPTVAVDLDGTIVEYDHWRGEDHFGAVRPGARESLAELKRRGCRLIVFTTRGATEKVRAWLETNAIPFDFINENPDQPEGASGKVIADAYLDDRAIRADGDWAVILDQTLTKLGLQALPAEDALEFATGVHAPKGYTKAKPLTIQGKQYVGGQFIPGAELAKATPQERAAAGVAGKSASPPGRPLGRAKVPAQHRAEAQGILDELRKAGADHPARRLRGQALHTAQFRDPALQHVAVKTIADTTQHKLSADDHGHMQHLHGKMARLWELAGDQATAQAHQKLAAYHGKQQQAKGAAAESAAKPAEKPAVPESAQKPEQQPAPAHEPTPEGHLQGASVEIHVPGGKALPARYEVRDLGQVRASHEVQSHGGFRQREAHEYAQGLQPRDYHVAGEQGKVLGMAERMIPQYTVSSHPDATSGPPVITTDGTVINGNGRQMSLEMSRNLGTYPKYKAELLRQAQQFGLDPKQIAGMKHPALYRVVDMQPDSEEAHAFARRGNVSTTQAQSPVRVAASLGGLVDDEVMNSLKLDDDTTFSEAVSQPQGKAFRKRLSDALPAETRAQYFHEDGRLTDAGKELTRNLLLAKVLPLDVIERAGEEMKAVKNTLEAAVPQLIQFKRDYPDSNPLPQLAHALSVLARNPRIKSASDADNALAQKSLWGGQAEPMEPGERMMLDFLLQDGQKPKVFRQKLGALVQDLEGRHGLFAAEMPDPVTMAAEALGVAPREGATFGRSDAAVGHELHLDPKAYDQKVDHARQQALQAGHTAAEVTEAIRAGEEAGEAEARREAEAGAARPLTEAKHPPKATQAAGLGDSALHSPWQMTREEMKAKGVTFFRTGQGSLYALHPKTGQTVRVKSSHAGHEVKDVGLKRSSDKTLYIDPEDAKRIGMWQTSSASGKRLILHQGHVFLVSKNASTGQHGRDEQPIKFHTEPRKGLSPLELNDRSSQEIIKGSESAWSGSHPGSPITDDVALEDGHKELIAAAHAAGESVPDEVLADYPHLRKSKPATSAGKEPQRSVAQPAVADAKAWRDAYQAVPMKPLTKEDIANGRKAPYQRDIETVYSKNVQPGARVVSYQTGKAGTIHSVDNSFGKFSVKFDDGTVEQHTNMANGLAFEDDLKKHLRGGAELSTAELSDDGLDLIPDAPDGVELSVALDDWLTLFSPDGLELATEPDPVPPTSPHPELDAIVRRATADLARLSALARADLLRALERSTSAGRLAAARRVLERYKAPLARLLTDAQLSAALAGMRRVAERLPAPATPAVEAAPPPALSPVPPPAPESFLVPEPFPAFTEVPTSAAEPVGPDSAPPVEPVPGAPTLEDRFPTGGPPGEPPATLPVPLVPDEPPIQLPMIDEAVAHLQRKRLVTPEEYATLRDQARDDAFSVAHVESEVVLDKIRGALTDAVAKGETLADFARKMDTEVAPGTFLSPGHQETVFRTAAHSAYSAGMDKLLEHPLLTHLYPYRQYTALHDDRVRPEHLALETLGIGGGPIYRADDPSWMRFRPPWSWNCRCGIIPISVDEAARRGIVEAQEYLRTGQWPQPPAHVPSPPFEPSPSWQRGGDLLMSLQEEGILLAHAPKGHTKDNPLRIGGHEYVGGEFIPQDVLEQASPEEKAQLSEGQRQDAGVGAWQKLQEMGAKLRHEAAPAVKARIDQLVQQLPEAARAPMANLWHMVHSSLMTVNKAARALATETARKKGGSAEEVEKLTRTLACVDLIGQGAAYAAAGTAIMVPGAQALALPAKLMTYVPVASIGYLLYSGATDPLATLKAAGTLLTQKFPQHVKGSFRFAYQAIRHPLTRAHAEELATAEDRRATDAALLLDRLMEHHGDERYLALVHAALDDTHDLAEALRLADAASAEGGAELATVAVAVTCRVVGDQVQLPDWELETVESLGAQATVLPSGEVCLEAGPDRPEYVRLVASVAGAHAGLPVELATHAAAGYTHDKPLVIGGHEYLGGEFLPDGGGAAAPAAPGPRTPEEEAAAEYREKGTRAKAFLDWFGPWDTDPASASKVVNAAGEPQETHPIAGEGSRVVQEGRPVPVYHGTPKGGFWEFDPERITDPEGLLYGPGFYFTEDSSVAQQYTEKNAQAAWELDRPVNSKDMRRLERWFHGDEAAELAAEDIGTRQVLRQGYRAWEVGKGAITDFLKRDEAQALRTVLAIDRKPSASRKVFACYLNIRKPFDASRELGDDEFQTITDAIARKTGVKVPDADRSMDRSGDVAYLQLSRAVGKATLQEVLQDLGYDGITHVGGNVYGGGHEHRVWIAFNSTQVKSVDNRGTFDPAENDIRLATTHAPAGGITIAGTRFAGGEFIPGDVMEKATPKEQEAVASAKQENLPTAKRQVYRVGNDHRLPTHWAYGEPWEEEEHVTQTGEGDYEVERTVADRRVNGAQVFEDLPGAIAATVWHPDGDYGSDDYSRFLLIDTNSKIGDGGHYYGSITSAERVRSISLDALHDWLREQLGKEPDDELDSREVSRFVEDNAISVRQWLDSHAETHPVEWHDSLPNPYADRE